MYILMAKSKWRETDVKIGAQLYNMAKSSLSFNSRLEIIKTLGYDAVELAGFNMGQKGYGNLEPNAFRQLVDDIGLEINGAHVSYGLLEDDMDQVIDYHKAADIHWIGISRPMPQLDPNISREEMQSIMSRYPNSKAQLDGIVENVRAFAKKLRAAGMDLYYHTHNREYVCIDGEYLIQRLLEETDVMLEVDICWAVKQALTPDELTAFILEHKDRVMWLHLKGCDKGESCPLDQGQLNCEFYYNLAKKLGHTYAIVEDDTQLPDVITGICRSMMAIREFEERGENKL